MKYFSVLILAFLMSSCCGTKKAIEAQPKQNTETLIVTEVPDAIEAPSTSNPSEEQKIELPLPPEPPILEEVDVIDHYAPEAFNHSRWNRLLQKNVSENVCLCPQLNLNLYGFYPNFEQLLLLKFI